MDIRKLKENFLKDVEGQVIQLEKEKERLESEKGYVLRKMNILEKYSKRKPKNENEFRELCSVVCFGSLNFCCGVKGNPYGDFKGCYWRDGVLSVLNISKEEFLEIKNCVEERIINHLVKREIP